MSSPEHLAARIVVLRGQRVILDLHLAQLYGVTTKRLNEQVRRNAARFPREFAFALTTQEVAILKPQFAASSWGGKRKLPLVFTEHGALMAAGVLNSRRAIEMSVYVVRAFVHMRNALRYDREILSALRSLMAPSPPQSRRRIGFVQDSS